MYHYLSLVCTALLLCIAPACKKEQSEPEPPQGGVPLQQRITGQWNVQSFFVDGTEMFGQTIEQSSIEFSPTASGNEGYMRWKIAHTDGSNKVEEGNYSVNATLGRIQVVTDKDLQITLYPIVRDSLHLDFSLLYFGEQILLKTTKKQ